MEMNDLIKSMFGERTKEEIVEEAWVEYKKTPESFSNWIFKVVLAKSVHKSSLKIPESISVLLNLKEFSYLVKDGNKEEEIKYLNEFLYKNTKSFMKGKKLFMKTGVFSNKFDFQNCYCGEKRDNLGEKLNEMYYVSMINGADKTIEVVFREYIEDAENRNTIYNGMPLRTEFRVFYDFDKRKPIGISNYWHPEVMTEKSLGKDYANYVKTRDLIIEEYDQFKYLIVKEVDNLMKDVELTGCWSVDVMKNGEDFWFIDMALMENSALVEYMEEIE